jgi:hypothetical protein
MLDLDLLDEEERTTTLLQHLQSLFDCCLFDSCQIRLLSVFKIDIDLIFVLF